jgi:hypothetical protein
MGGLVGDPGVGRCDGGMRWDGMGWSRVGGTCIICICIKITPLECLGLGSWWG